MTSRHTQQDEDAGQDGDERAAAEAGGLAVGLGVAGHGVAVVVAAAHLDGHGGRAGLHRLLPVRDDQGQVEDDALPLGPASAPGQDPRRVVWWFTRCQEHGGEGCGGGVSCIFGGPHDVNCFLDFNFVSHLFAVVSMKK